MNARFFKNPNFIFFVSIGFISILYNYHEILFHKPYSIHQWRQSDCLSITMNFYQENRNFLEPAIHWMGEKDGKTISECPLIYFTVAKLWKIFGHQEFIFRLINLLLVYLGLFCLFRLLQGMLNDTFWSISITVLLFTSPILVYYSNNFTADAPAFGLSLTGCYFMWRGIQFKKNSWFFISFVFFLLGGLIKISSLLAFMAFFIIHVYQVLFSKKEEKSLFQWFYLLPYVFVLLVQYIWFNYVQKYNQENVGGIFLTEIFPIWDIDEVTRVNIWKLFIIDLVPAYLDKKLLYFEFLLFISLFFVYKKAHQFLLYFTLLIVCGMAAFIVLFYKAFTVHDYYLTNLLVFVPLPLLLLLELVKRKYVKLFSSNYLKTIMLVFMSLMVFKTAIINREKYSTDDWIAKLDSRINKERFEKWESFHANYKKNFKAYETITPYLRSIGINRNDRVLSLPDESINISLYLMDQKGYSGYGYSGITFDKKIQKLKENGVKYLIVTEQILNEPYLKPYITQKIGNYANISIFRL